MKNDRLPKIVFFGQPSRAKRKADHPRLGLKDFMKKDFKGNGNFLGGCKEGSVE